MDIATIRKLAAAPIEFVGTVAVPGGGKSISLEAEDLEAFCADPEGYFARQQGVTKDEYLQWVATDGTPRCGALNSQGAPCGNRVSGESQMGLGRWLQEEGGFCAIHGCATSAEARAKK